MPYVAALKRVYEVQRAWIKKTRRQMLSAIARVAGIPLVEAPQRAEDPDLLRELAEERQRMETGGGILRTTAFRIGSQVLMEVLSLRDV